MPLSPRSLPSVMWTGSEFLVWGAGRGPDRLTDGAAFDPATGRWRPIATNDRVGPGRAVWAGDRMVVLFGPGGEAYDPVTDSWSSLPSLTAADPLGFTNAVWVDGSLLGVGVWGRENQQVTDMRVGRSTRRPIGGCAWWTPRWKRRSTTCS